METEERSVSRTVIEVFADGGVFGHNPSPTGIYWSAGYRREDGEWDQRRGTSGKFSTNNEAEYHALIEALTLAVELTEDPSVFVAVKMDSQLIVNHFNRVWRCKQGNLQGLLLRAWELRARLPKGRFAVYWVRRAAIFAHLGH